MNKFKKEEKGITLVALAITIIVLLIMAGVAVSMIIGYESIIVKAQEAKETWDTAEKNEEEAINNLIEVDVAQVGETKYKNIDEAIANWKNGTTLKLMADVTLTDTIQLLSTEYHVLNLDKYTMTAASGKDAIKIVPEGVSSPKDALKIEADAENPGGITATGKAVITSTGKSGVKDRPIIRIYGGVFNGTNIVKHSGSNSSNSPQFFFYGGEFNGAINTNRSLNQFHGGKFNGNLQMSVDSTSYTLINGGTFKKLSNLAMSSLSNTKFTIGSAKSTYDRGVYVNDEQYYVVEGSAITEPGTKFKACVSMNPGTNDYFSYSSVKDNGLYYTNVNVALSSNNKTSSVVTVYTDNVELIDLNFKGTINIPEDRINLVITFNESIVPSWTVTTSVEGKEVTFTDVISNGTVTRTYNVVTEENNQ